MKESNFIKKNKDKWSLVEQSGASQVQDFYDTYNNISNDSAYAQTKYKNRSVIKEYRASFLNKFEGSPNLKGTEMPNLEVFQPKNGTWLGGIGSGAWFKIERKISDKKYKIARYTSDGIKDFENDFLIDNDVFNHEKHHQFIHPTNCTEIYIQQNNIIYSSKIS